MTDGTTSIQEHLTKTLRSDQLAPLRGLLREWISLKEIVGPIAQFNVVVDANFLLPEIRWMVLKKKNPSATTALHESIVASTIICHVTEHVVEEVEHYLREMALETKSHLDAWFSEWLKLKALLWIHQPNPAIVEKYLSGRDPDDAPTLALAEELSACGILSYDQDIGAMGGAVIPDKFVKETRDYSRKTVIYASIQVNGYFIAAASIGVIRALIEVLRVVWTGLQVLPAPLKAIAIAGLIAVLLNPKWRDATYRKFSAMGAVASEMAPKFIDVILDIAQLAQANKVTAPAISHI